MSSSLKQPLSSDQRAVVPGMEKKNDGRKVTLRYLGYGRTVQPEVVGQLVETLTLGACAPTDSRGVFTLRSGRSNEPFYSSGRGEEVVSGH